MSPPALETIGLTKRFRGVKAVDELSFRVEPGRITGFLGPNGAGKTTTLRCLLGLVKPSDGEALVQGQPYREIPHPAARIGAVLEATGFHPGRSATDHLRIQAASIGGITDERTAELLDFVGLSNDKHRRVGGYSLGMRQRLALALALLPDPEILILDEPANGLDPAGIAWLRQFLRHLTEVGHTVLVSSHLLAEVKQSVDDVVILNHGKLVRQGPLDQVLGAAALRVRGPDLTALAQALRAANIAVTKTSTQELTVQGAELAQVGQLAFQTNTELHELTETTSDLEQEFLKLTDPS